MDLWAQDSYRLVSLWIVKGLFLGIWLFSFGTIAFLYLELFRRLPPNTSVDVRNFSLLTVMNPSWWIALVASICIGMIVVRAWHIRPIVWAGLIVTELFPVALLTMFIVLVRRLKDVADR